MIQVGAMVQVGSVVYEKRTGRMFKVNKVDEKNRSILVDNYTGMTTIDKLFLFDEVMLLLPDKNDKES